MKLSVNLYVFAKIQNYIYSYEIIDEISTKLIENRNNGYLVTKNKP